MQDCQGSFHCHVLCGSERWTFASVFLIGLSLRLAVLNQPIRNDEAVSYVEIAARSLRTVLMDSWSKFHALNNILVYVSTQIFGDAEWAIRLPVFLAGLVVILLTYWLGSTLFSGRSGLIGAGLAAVAWPMVEYSANARGYILGTAFMLISVHLLHYASKVDNRAAWCGGAVTASLSIFCVPTMVISMMAVALWVVGVTVVERRQSLEFLAHRATLSAITAVAVTLILYLPYWVVEGPKSLFEVPSSLVPSPDATVYTAGNEFLSAMRLVGDMALPFPIAAGWGR